MKKTFLSIILCFMLALSSFAFVGCKGANYSKDNVATLLTTMKTDEATSEFFEGNFVKVSFDSSKVSQTQSDKAYIFPAIYSYYLTSASRLFLGVVDRYANASYAVSDFNQQQINTIYTKLENVYAKLKALSASKLIYETSNGNLHYKNVISDYNALIEAFYSLNDSFAEFYFVDEVAKTDFLTDELSNSNVRDMLSYLLLEISKVSYRYDLLNFIYTNPLGEVVTWYNATTYLKGYVNVCYQTLIDLQNSNDLALSIAPNTQEAKILLSSFQDQEAQYKNEYNLFLQALNNFDVKAYYNSNNKEAYLENISQIELSSFNIMQNFLEGRYSALINGLIKINGFI